jgi:chromosome transmission fidelity protein 18
VRSSAARLTCPRGPAPCPHPAQKAASVIGRAAESESQRSARLFSLLQDFGEPELVLAGVHENLPSLHFFDMALSRTVQVLGHLQDADAMLRRMQRTGDYGLLRYLPAAALSISALVAGPEKPALAWPRAAGEARRRGAANRAVLQQWMMGMAPAAYAALGPAAAAGELLPMLPHLTTPALRPVSRHLFSADEQAAVDGLVDSMLTLGLKFAMHMESGDGEGEGDPAAAAAAAAAAAGRPSRLAPAEPPLQFLPPVHRLWGFAGHRPRAGRALPMATRQMVGHEAQLEGIRRAERARREAAGGAASPGAGGPSPMQADGGGGGGGGGAAAAGGGAAVRAHVQLDLAQRLREAGVAARAKAAKDGAPRGTWLDQLRDARHAAQRRADAVANGADAEGRGGAGRLPVLYKFHEGYTNAVKRPVLMAELLV